MKDRDGRRTQVRGQLLGVLLGHDLAQGFVVHQRPGPAVSQPVAQEGDHLLVLIGVPRHHHQGPSPPPAGATRSRAGSRPGSSRSRACRSTARPAASRSARRPSARPGSRSTRAPARRLPGRVSPVVWESASASARARNARSTRDEPRPTAAASRRRSGSRATAATPGPHPAKALNRADLPALLGPHDARHQVLGRSRRARQQIPIEQRQRLAREASRGPLLDLSPARRGVDPHQGLEPATQLAQSTWQFRSRFGGLGHGRGQCIGIPGRDDAGKLGFSSRPSRSSEDVAGGRPGAWTYAPPAVAVTARR